MQAFPDETIYWRDLREVATFFEQRPHLKAREWQAIVLWLDKADDPGFGTLRLLTRKPKPKLVSLDLIELLKKLPETSLALNVLRPLLAKDEREVRENVWARLSHSHSIPFSSSNCSTPFCQNFRKTPAATHS